MGTDDEVSRNVRESANAEAGSNVVYMDEEMQFSCCEFASSFQTKISETARKRIWAYWKGRSSAKAIRLLGLNCDEKTFGKRLREITQRMGAKSSLDLFPRTKKATSQIDAAFLKKLIEKQEYRCALSGVVLTPDEAELDHIVPFEQGGKHVKSNVQWVHREVNRMKAQMRQVEFIEWCRKVSMWSS
jgi:5-methylcytosine-specific restriction endonuclease McrA